MALPAIASAPQNEYQHPTLQDAIQDSLARGIDIPSNPPPSRGRHPTKVKVSFDAAYNFLSGSPLQPYAQLISESDYGATILGICQIEQWGCKRAPYFSPYNFWGIGGASDLQRYGSYEEGIQAIDTLLTSYDAKGISTVEQLNGFYVQPASDTWYHTVLSVQQSLQ